MLKMQDWDDSPAEIVHIYIWYIYIILNITFLCMIGESSASPHDMGRQEFWLASSAEIGLHAVNNITMQKWNLSRRATCMSSTLPCEHIQSSKWDFDQQQPWMAVI